MGIRKYKTPEIIHITKQDFLDKIFIVSLISSVIAFCMGYALPFILARIFA